MSGIASCGPTETRDRLRGYSVCIGHRRRHHLYQTALAYHSVGRLSVFITEVFVGRPWLLRPLSRLPIQSIARAAGKLASYSEPAINAQVRVVPRVMGEQPVWWMLGTATIARRGGAFAEVVAQYCETNGAAIHMACGQAMEVFARLDGRGLPRVLEQTTPDRRRGREILAEEHRLLGLHCDEAALDRHGLSLEKVEQNERELAMADMVVAISPLVACTLVEAGVNVSRICVATVGVDTARFPPGGRTRRAGEALRIAFVGNNPILKGLVYVLRAAKLLVRRGNPAEVHVFGRAAMPPTLLEGVRDVVTFHESLPRDELVSGLHRCHVAALPSLWEGFGMSVYECMSAGLPVIVSRNVGAVVVDGINGFTVPIRDVEAIRGCLEMMLVEDVRERMASAAIDAARGQTWNRYRSCLLGAAGLA